MGSRQFTPKISVRNMHLYHKMLFFGISITETEYSSYFLAHLHLLLCLERASPENVGPSPAFGNSGNITYSPDKSSPWSSCLHLLYDFPEPFLDLAPLILFCTLLSSPLVITQPHRHWNTFMCLSIMRGKLQCRAQGPL